jgi:ATP-dependent Clp protease protease subunit
MNDVQIPGLRRFRALAPTRAGGGKWYSIQAAASGSEATVYIYDFISDSADEWYGGVSASRFVRDIAALDVETLHVRINSPGGDVFAAMTIYNALKRHPARIVTHVDGVAASAAGAVALAGDEVLMGVGSFFMIHNPWVIAVGDAAELRAAADMVEKVEETLAGIYVEASGIPVEQVRELMAAETWYTADGAVAAGFADAVEDGSEAGPTASAKFDLSVFAHAPDDLRVGGNGDDGAGRGRPATIREFEAGLRDEFGLTHTEARRAAASVFRTETDPRDEGDEGADALALSNLLNAAVLNARLRLKVGTPVEMST